MLDRLLIPPRDQVRLPWQDKMGNLRSSVNESEARLNSKYTRNANACKFEQCPIRSQVARLPLPVKTAEPICCLPRFHQSRLMGRDFTTTIHKQKHPIVFSTPTKTGRRFGGGTILIAQEQSACHSTQTNSARRVSKRQMSQNMSLPKHKCPTQQNQNKLSTIRVRKETNSVGRHLTNIAWLNHLSKHRVTNSANRASDTSRPCLSHQVRGQCLKLCRPLPPSKNQLVIFPIPDE